MLIRRDSRLTKRASRFALLCIAIFVCITPRAKGQERMISQDGLSLTYDMAAFSKVEVVEEKREPLPHPRDQLNVHPARLTFRFYVRSGYAGVVQVYPLEDRSMRDFNAAYPELSARAEKLARLLRDRPALPQRYPSGAPKEIPTIRNQMA